MAQDFRFPTTGVGCDRRALLLAIDDVLLPMRRGLCYYLSKPSVRAEPVLLPSHENPAAPDSHAAHFYGTVLEEGGKFRMWYYACHLGINADWPPEQLAQAKAWGDGLQVGPLCYAESEDGLRWTKPALGQVLFKGTLENNAFALPNGEVATATVLRDDAEAFPQRRYKMIYNYYDKRECAAPAERGGAIRTATSPDGIAWTAGPRLALETFLEHSSFYRHAGLYVVSGQKVGGYCPGEGGSTRGRQGCAHVSTDFDHWVQEHVEAFALPDPREADGRGFRKPYDQVHLGVGARSFGNVLVGLYGRWHDKPRFGDISCDLGLVVSNEGLHFREPVKGRVFIAGDESLVTPAPGKDYPTILCQAHGILNVGDQTRIYHGRWRNAPYMEDASTASEYWAEVALATLPRDRWGALGLAPEAQEGTVWSAPVTLPEGGCALSLNADGADGMRVEVADENFHLLEGLAGVPEGKGGIECAVRWSKGDLAALAGQTVRFRVHLKRQDVEPRLYALYLDV